MGTSVEGALLLRRGGFGFHSGIFLRLWCSFVFFIWEVKNKEQLVLKLNLAAPAQEEEEGDRGAH